MRLREQAVSRKGAGYFLLDHMLIVILVLLAVVTAIVEPTFLSIGNLTAIMRQFGALSFMALGLTFAIISGFIDLSIPGVINIAAVMAIYLINPLGQWGALLTTLAFGLLVGLLNGFLITKSGGTTQAEGLFITFGMSQVWSAAAMLLSGGSTQQLRWCTRDYSLFTFLGSYKIVFVPIAIVIFVIALLILNFVQKKTYAGRCMSLVGGNKTAARLSGVEVNRSILRTFMIGGLMTVVGAIMLMSRVTTASPTVGLGYDNNAILSVVVGGTSLAGGSGSVFGTMLGVLLVTLLANCMNLLGVSSHLQYVMNGAVLIFAIWADSRKNRMVK
ncbi:MAG: ABC transporter permease [Oscillospiraceae bacterium]|nr:ABC transporter permease [Oscillospiraceae bacterium]